MKEFTLGLHISSVCCSLSFFEDLKNKPLRLLANASIDAPEGGACDIFNHHVADMVEVKIREFEQQNRVKINNIFCSLPVEKVTKLEGQAQMVLHPRGARQVRSAHISKAVEQARLLSLDWHYRPIHSFPVEFKLDGKVFNAPPLGVYGRKLEVRVLFYVVDNDYNINLDNFFLYMGRKCTAYAVSALCEAAALKTEELKRGNFAVFNIGPTKAELSYFNDFALSDIKCFSYDDGTVDKFISKTLQLPLSLAKEVKATYGSLDASCSEDKRDIVLKVNDRQKTIKCLDVYKVLDEFYSSLFKRVDEYLIERGILQSIDCLYPTGDWEEIKGAVDYLRAKMSCTVELPHWVSEIDSTEAKDFKESYGIVCFIRSKFNFEKAYRFSNKLWMRLKNIWEEYF